MERRVGIYEMRSKLGELVRAAAAGETITVNVRGNPVAKLVPYRDSNQDVAAWFKTRAEGAAPWGVTARELVVEGRR